MKAITLYHGEETIVDDEDYERISQSRLCLNKDGYAIGNPKKLGSVFVHRAVLNLTDKKVFVDHINGNKLDNRKSNLRLATTAQNNRNMGRRRDNTSGFKGVVRNRNKKRWIAEICLNGVTVHIGTFDTPKEAARAYDKEALKHFGEFARPNFPDLSRPDFSRSEPLTI